MFKVSSNLHFLSWGDSTFPHCQEWLGPSHLYPNMLQPFPSTQRDFRPSLYSRGPWLYPPLTNEASNLPTCPMKLEISPSDLKGFIIRHSSSTKGTLHTILHWPNGFQIFLLKPMGNSDLFTLNKESMDLLPLSNRIWDLCPMMKKSLKLYPLNNVALMGSGSILL